MTFGPKAFCTPRNVMIGASLMASSLASVRNRLPPSDKCSRRSEARASKVRATTCRSGGSPASALGRRHGLAGSEQPSSIAEGARVVVADVDEQAARRVADALGEAGAAVRAVLERTASYRLARGLADAPAASF